MTLERFTAVAYSLRPVLSVLSQNLTLKRCKAVAYSLKLDLSVYDSNFDFEDTQRHTIKKEIF